MAKRSENRTADSAPGKKIFFMGGGGGGKTTLAMLAASTALARGIGLNVYDMDRGNQSLHRYFHDIMLPEHMVDRGSLDPLDVPDFLEEQVFGDAGNAIIDVGANLEDGILFWLNGRGIAVADQIRIICPVQKKDGVSAVHRIFQNADVAKLLVLNLAGARFARNARDSELYQELLESGVHEALLPVLTDTLHLVDRESLRPDIMLARGGLFDRTGATILMRHIEHFFDPYPEFRIW